MQNTPILYIMKFLIALAFMMTSLLGTSSACAHAMGVNTLQANSERASEHHAMHEHDTQTSSHHDMHGKTHESCPNDCDGGPDCAGCSAIPASVVVDDFSFQIPPISTHFSMNDVAGFDKTYALEPPPPRTI